MAQSTEYVENALNSFKVNNEQLCCIRNRMRGDIKSSLRKKTRKRGTMKMLPSYVRSLPDGSENGDFLALDLGGTNFRVLRVTLPENGGKVRVHSQVYRVPNCVMSGTAEQLFDHIATCIKDFWETHDLGDRSIPMGFTFSFPCVQTSLNKSKLLRWTKGFNVEGVVGNDPVELLNEALTRQRINNGFQGRIDTVAIINDTVGTMMSCAYDHPGGNIGLIVGTGTNACYMESVENMDQEVDENNNSEYQNHPEMCVNTEWGCFGENGSLKEILTKFDEKVDQWSINPKRMIYEKMISGMYMGEIVRWVVLDLINAEVLFPGQNSEKLKKHNSFPTSFLTQIEGDNSAELKSCAQVFKYFGFDKNTVEDRQLVKRICQAVSQRAAYLCAAGVSALVDQMRDNRRKKHPFEDNEERFRVTVGVDGTVYKKHPTFKTDLQRKIIELSPHSEVVFKLSSDGSGKGAALVTAVTCRLLNNELINSNGLQSLNLS